MLRPRDLTIFAGVELLTPRLRLRRWLPHDLAPFREINADARVMEFYPSTLGAEESDRIIERAEAHFDRHLCGLFAVELLTSRRLAGFVGLQWIGFEAAFTPAIEIGWRIAFDLWNQGYATEAARAVMRDGFERLELKEIVSMTAVINRRSQRVMEKLGMTRDPLGDFEHPRLADGHALRPHVLYRLARPDFKGEEE